MPTIVAFTGFEFGTEVGIGTGGTGSTGPFDGTTGTVTTDYQVVAGTPVVGSYVGRLNSLANKNYFWNTTTLGSGNTSLVVSLRFMFTTLPATAIDFHSIDTAAATDRSGFYYDPADQKVHAWITSATQASSTTIVANTWYTLQFRFSCSANPNTLDWTFNGVAQTTVSNALGATTVTRYALGNRSGGAGVVSFDDVAVSVTSGDYPLPVYQVRMLTVDTGGTTTQIGTTDATVRFTANGTLDGTHNSANILSALSEVPPLLGATSSGVTQQTAGAGNAVELPMTNYTLTGGETVVSTRIYVSGWAASATAANLGLRAWNGTAETTLHGDSACGFDNSSNGIWYTYLYSGVTDQTTLNALAIRLGYSTDVAPTPGAHAVYAEVLILPGAGGTSLADVAGGGAASGETGPESISTVLNDPAGGGAGAGSKGPEASTVAVADIAGGGAGAGSAGPETISAVLNDVSGGGAASGETGPETNGSSLNVPAGGGAASGATGPESTTVVFGDVTGGGAGAGGTANAIATVLADVAGGGAASGETGPESASSGGAPVVLADVAGGGAVSGGTIETPVSSEVVHDPMVLPVLVKALACLQAQAPIWPNAPALFQVRPGNAFVASADSAHDECCAGIAWVRMGTMWPTENFPIQKVDVGNSEETDWAVQIEFGIQRCIPTQGDDGVYGSVVTSVQWAAAVEQETDDAHMLRKAACCLRDTIEDITGRPLGNQGFLMGVQTPLENSGPCGGIMLMATVRVPACDCVS